MSQADSEPPTDRPPDSGLNGSSDDGTRSPPPLVTLPQWQRALLLAAGFLSLGLGVLGIFLPLLPTTPLVLLAAFFFARGSERAHKWLLGHRVFGPTVREWEEHRRIPQRAKRVSIVLVIVAFTVSALLAPRSIYLYSILIISGTALVVFLARLPTSPGEE